MRPKPCQDCEFNQNTSQAKRAALRGPVVITDRGEPAHVLMTFEAYKRLAGGRQNIDDLLAMPEAAAEVELPIRVSTECVRPADLS